MPELPEVETVARQLAPMVTGRRIQRLDLLDPKLVLPDRELLRGCRIREVTRKGKEIVLGLVRPPRRTLELWLGVHLRMTGRLIYRAHGPYAEDKHLRARFVLDRGRLLFSDPRRFGVLRTSAAEADLEAPGQEPLAADFTAARLGELLAGGRGEIKPWLLRQDKITGLGNLYVAEILFATGIDPHRRSGDLSWDEIKRLHRATRSILRRAIDHCGTTFSDFQDARGMSGGFRKFLKVYACEGEPCVRCGRPIERFVQGGRSTFWCPRCQGG